MKLFLFQFEFPKNKCRWQWQLERNPIYGIHILYILFRRGKYIDVKILALNIKTKIHYIFSMFNVSQKLSVFVENFLRIRLGNSQGIVGNWSWIKLKRRLYIPAKLKLGLQESLNVKERKKRMRVMTAQYIDQRGMEKYIWVNHYSRAVQNLFRKAIFLP